MYNIVTISKYRLFLPGFSYSFCYSFLHIFYMVLHTFTVFAVFCRMTFLGCEETHAQKMGDAQSVFLSFVGSKESHSKENLVKTWEIPGSPITWELPGNKKPGKSQVFNRKPGIV